MEQVSAVYSKSSSASRRIVRTGSNIPAKENYTEKVRIGGRNTKIKQYSSAG